MIKKTRQSLKKLYDEQTGARAFRVAADQDGQRYPDTQLALAKMYETGAAAVKQDFVVAYCLYHLAAKKGVIKAEDKLRLLELIMPAEQWREAKALIRDLEEKESLK